MQLMLSGSQKNGKSILDWGDLSVLSFHATKAFNTVEAVLLLPMIKS